MKRCNTPCRECPFRRDSQPGYLGGAYTPEEFAAQHIQGEGLNPCHMTVDTRRDDWRETFLTGDNGLACEGQARFFRNNCKAPRPGSLIVVYEGEPDPNVFDWTFEFTEHHTITED